MEDRRLAVLFPGIGYHCDKPLLYYSAKLARAAGYEVLPVPYGGFPEKVRGDADKMRESFEIAWSQAEAMLATVKWAEYRDILFVGKSIGTAVGCAYAHDHQISCRQILFTPVEDTFRWAGSGAIAFHGTADPWADTKVIEGCCAVTGIRLYETEGANHSLETGDVDRDIEIMRSTMRTVRDYAASC